MARMVRARHRGERKVPLDRLYGERRSVGRPEAGAELARPLADLGTAAGVEGRGEGLTVEALDRNRLRARGGGRGPRSRARSRIWGRRQASKAAVRVSLSSRWIGIGSGPAPASATMRPQ